LTRADRQQMRMLKAPAKRGEIVDREDRVLAYSVDADTIVADPSAIDDPDAVAAKVCRVLEDCDPKDRQAMARSLRRNSQFTYLARKVSPDEAKRVRALELTGVGFVNQSRPHSPNNHLLPHVLASLA